MATHISHLFNIYLTVFCFILEYLFLATMHKLHTMPHDFHVIHATGVSYLSQFSQLIVKTPIMPEYPECLILGLLISWFLSHLLKNKLGDTLFVLDLWADATAPELASAKRGSPESLGVPYRLNNKCKLK